jgi:predicted GTPase
MRASDSADYLVAAIEADLPTLHWSTERKQLVEASYKRYLVQAVTSGLVGEELAIRLSAYRAAIGY